MKCVKAEEKEVHRMTSGAVNPVISVIIPFFNQERFLSEAVESVLHQQYGDWELVLVDDGSSDASTEVARSYAAAQPGRISYHEHDRHLNKGLSASRNLGISRAKGELVAFLDSDDVWQPEFLGHQIKLMRQFEVALICEASDYWYSWDDPRRSDVRIRVGCEQDRVFDPPELMTTLYPLGRGAAPCTCGMLVRKVALIKHGGFDEAFTGMYEDQVFLSKFYLNESILISSSCFNKYRQRLDSMMGTSKKDNGVQVAREKYLIWFQGYLSQCDKRYPEVDRLLKRALFPFLHPGWFYIRNTLPRVVRRRVGGLVPSKIKRVVRRALRVGRHLIRRAEVPDAAGRGGF